MDKKSPSPASTAGQRALARDTTFVLPEIHILILRKWLPASLSPDPSASSDLLATPVRVSSFNGDEAGTLTGDRCEKKSPSPASTAGQRALARDTTFVLPEIHILILRKWLPASLSPDPSASSDLLATPVRVSSFNGDEAGTLTGDRCETHPAVCALRRAQPAVSSQSCSALRLQSYLPHILIPDSLPAAGMLCFPCGPSSLAKGYAYSSSSSSFGVMILTAEAVCFFLL